MAESNLAYDYDDFCAEIGERLGYTRDDDDWTADELAEIERFLQKGVRRFYLPPKLKGQSKAHRWSFLKLSGTIVTEADTESYDMPDSFGNIEGALHFDPSEAYLPVKTVSITEIDRLRSRGSASGYPRFVAIVPQAIDDDADPVEGQRFKAEIWPTPDGAYNLNYHGNVLQRQVTSDYPYPLGGQVHTETIMAACRAVIEQHEGEKGIEWQTFIELLEASIDHDLSLAPEFYGYNGDDSDLGGGSIDRATDVTYNGNPIT